MNRDEMRKFILEMKEPFNSADLFVALSKEEEHLKQQKGECLEASEEGHDDKEKENVELRNLAWETIDELMNYGLIDFRKFGESSWKYCVL